MRRISRRRAILVLLGLAAAVATPARDAGPRLVVHEWGTFTSVVGENGIPVEWRPLSGPQDLPDFVYRASDPRIVSPPRADKAALRALVRMETPVLYFYAERATTVTASVSFPDGALTEWYPAARAGRQSLAWGPLSLQPGAEERFRSDATQSHYYLARDTDATPLAAGAEAEKFLFYRGVGSFFPPVWLRLDGSHVVASRQASAIRRIVLFENRGGAVGFRLETLGRTSRLARPRLDGSVEGVCDVLRTLLTDSGLYPREADAMIDTWRDSWFEEGLRALYLLPQSTTDGILPLRLEPRPAELVRVLVARTEVIAPQDIDVVAAAVRQLQSPDLAERSAGADAIRARGRFAEPILRRLAARGDAGTRATVEALLKAGEPVETLSGS